jgi:hypothetical protein
VKSRRPIVGELHQCAASVGLDVATKRRHLEGPAKGDHGHGAMRDAGRRGLQAGGFGARYHLGGREDGGKVGVGHLAADKRVADRAADDARGTALAVESIEHGPHVGLPQKCPVAKRRLHRTASAAWA